MSEYDHEPIRGLPADLPPGESIIWQGSPQWRGLAQQAFHIRAIAAYFAVLVIWALVSGSWLGIGLTLAGATLGLLLMAGLSWLSARTTVYTITNKRVVLRFGMALPKCVNLPFAAIGAASVAVRGGGEGDIPLEIADRHIIGYIQFWPHARPWYINRPQPMLRSVPDAAHVAALLGAALHQAKPRAPQASLRSEPVHRPIEALAA
ncbi:MAG: photosynthetic complex putative assembly protein PuhB [Sphingomonadaceae bacterium]